MNESIPLRRALATVEIELQTRLPARSAQWQAILGAITVQLEMPTPCRPAVESLVHALTGLLDDANVDTRHSESGDALTAIVNLARTGHTLALEPPASAPQDDENPPASFSLGPRLAAIVSCLRLQLGLPVDGIYLFLTQYFGVQIPLPDLKQIILTLPPPEPPSASQRRRRPR